jgi:hypothetical protein
LRRRIHARRASSSTASITTAIAAHVCQSFMIFLKTGSSYNAQSAHVTGELTTDYRLYRGFQGWFFEGSFS